MYSSRHKAFTIVEIMVLIAVIGLLATLAVPYFRSVRESAQNSYLINNWRVFSDAYEQYAKAQGDYPPDANRGIVPNGMAEYLSNTIWKETTPMGGNWDWDVDGFGINAGVSLVDANLGILQMQNIDFVIDDGDLSLGIFQRVGATRYCLIMDK